MINSFNMMRKTLRSGTAFHALALLGAGLGAVAVAAPAAAQDYTNTNATGRVQGTNGEPIAGATVTVTSDAQGFTRSVTTSSDGSYRVASIPQGSYTFTIEAPGFDTYTEQGVNLAQSASANQFTLAPAGSAAAAGGDIVVTAGRVQVSDFDRNTVGAVIAIGELATRVPVSRDLTSVVLLAPGTTLGDSAFGALPSVAGSSVSENAYYINGLNITEFRQGLEPVTVPFEFYNTIEVKNGSIPAEFGRFTGAFVNATTKSGGNEFHGGMLFNWQPDDLREDNPDTITNYNRTDVRERQQANFYLSGPIIKDHLFFYGIYQSNNNRNEDTLLTSNPNSVQVIRDANGVITSRQQIPPFGTGLRRNFVSNTSPFYGAKIDAVIVDGQRLEFTYFNTKSRQVLRSFNVVDELGGTYDSRVDRFARTGGYQGGGVTLFGGENFVGRYTGQFTDWLTLSGAYGVNKNRAIAGSANDALPFVSDTSGQFNPALSGNPVQQIQEDSDKRTFYRGDVDVYVNLLGQHHFRGGYDREELQSVSRATRTGGFDYAYAFAQSADQYAPANTLYVGRTTYVNGGTFTSLNEAAYLQDSWSGFGNRVNITGGVRWDRFKADNVAGQRYYDSGDQFAPRISFSLDPIGDQRTKIYGFFGRYYLPVPTNTNIRLAGAELFFTEYFRVASVGANNVPVLGAPLLYAGAGICPSTGVRNCDVNDNGVPSPTDSTVSTTLKPQSIDEYVLGYEQRLGARWRVGAFGTYRKLNQSLEDVAIDLAVNNYCARNNIRGCDDIFTGFHQYVLTNPGQPLTVNLSDPIGGEATTRQVTFSAAELGYPKAERTYRAVTLTLDREFDGIWSFSGSYTYAKNIGNIEGGIRSDNGQSDSGLTTAFDQPGLTVGAFGYLPTDVRHNIKGYGSLRLFPWLTVGVQTQVQSPRRYACLGTVPDRVDPFARQYGAAGYFCNVANGSIITNPATPVTQANLQQVRRGTSFQGDWQSFTNLSLAFKLPTDLFSGTFRVDVFNLFAEQAKIDFEERGTQNGGNPRGDYGFVNTYQAPRSIRLQLGFDF
ncbi:MAG TPA: carboxypeptidase regulatory-like domain-containing protein [Sphingomonas sp.]